jgi:hypothetical protein
MTDLDMALFGPPSQDASADESRAQELETSATYGDLKAVQTSGQMTLNLSDSLANIDAVMAASAPPMEEGEAFSGRFASGGGTGIYSGGAYDQFRRSDDIEDRRNQKYSQNPQGPTKILFEAEWSRFADDMLRGTSPLSKALGIGYIPTK